MLCRLLSKSVAALALLLSVNQVCIAEDLTVSGFAGLGMAHTSANNFLGNDRNSHPVIELGLSASYQLSNNFSLSGQVGFRKFGEAFSDDAPRIDFASINYSTNALGYGEQSFSLGRVKVKAGLYNATRDVPSTRPSILLAQSIYLDVFRNSLLSVDGLQFSTVHEFGNGLITIEGVLGLPEIDDAFTNAMFDETAYGSWDSNTSKNGYISYSDNNMNLALTYSSFAPRYKATVNDLLIVIEGTPPIGVPIIDGTNVLKTTTLSAQFFFGKLEWTNEYLYRKVDVSGFIPNRAPVENPNEGYYTQLRYPVSDQFSVFARWDRFYRFANDKKRQRDAIIDAPRWSETTTARSIGLTWQFDRNWQVSAEVHKMNGSAWLPPFAITSAAANQSQRWTLVAAQLAYRF